MKFNSAIFIKAMLKNICGFSRKLRIYFCGFTNNLEYLKFNKKTTNKKLC